jgi:hypothetical protein
MLILVARGAMPSMQYGMRIERVRVLRRELRVDVCNWDPARDEAQFWAVPWPLDIVRVARSELPVRFVDHRTINSSVYRDASGLFPQCLVSARRRVRNRALADHRRGGSLASSQSGRSSPKIIESWISPWRWYRARR